MTWFKVDDGFADHPKVARLQTMKGWQGALALWTLAGAWASKHLTDGAVPAVMVLRLGCTARDAELLVDAELWLSVDDGFTFHDWQARNPLRTDVEAKREMNRQRVAKWKEKTSANAFANALPAAPGNAGANAAPDPTRPDPTNSSSLRSEEKPRAGAPEVSDPSPHPDIQGMQLAISSAAFAMDWSPAPQLSLNHQRLGAVRAAEAAKARGITRDEAAAALARAALQAAKERGRPDQVGFLLVSVDPWAPAGAQTPSRSGRLPITRGTTAEDFADEPDLDVQLQRFRDIAKKSKQGGSNGTK